MNNSLKIDEYPDIMTVEEMCEYLRISDKTGYKLLHNGTIKCLKPGKAYLIPKKFIIEYIDKQLLEAFSDDIKR